MRSFVAWTVLAVLSLTACTASGSPTPSPEATLPAVTNTSAEAGEAVLVSDVATGPWRFVALGDGYTAGSETELPRRDSWPAQLVEALKRGDMSVFLTNLAARSNTSWQVLNDQLPQVGGYQPDVVTLQVGINDLLYGESEEYRENVAAILDELLVFMPAERIFAIVTPSEALSAAGDAFGAQAEVESAIAELNEVLFAVAAERGVMTIDIGSVSELTNVDASLTVVDGPWSYPTAKQYAGWAEIIGPHVHDALTTNEP